MTWRRQSLLGCSPSKNKGSGMPGLETSRTGHVFGKRAIATRSADEFLQPSTSSTTDKLPGLGTSATQPNGSSISKDELKPNQVGSAGKLMNSGQQQGLEDSSPYPEVIPEL